MLQVVTCTGKLHQRKHPVGRKLCSSTPVAISANTTYVVAYLSSMDIILPGRLFPDSHLTVRLLYWQMALMEKMA
jgi:hypothetical protein